MLYKISVMWEKIRKPYLEGIVKGNWQIVDTVHC